METMIWLAMFPVAVLLEVAGLLAMKRDRGPREAPDFSRRLQVGRQVMAGEGD
jgi:hypothetical protein